MRISMNFLSFTPFTFIRDANLDSMMNTGELVGENSDDMINLELIEKREHQQKMHKV